MWGRRASGLRWLVVGWFGCSEPALPRLTGARYVRYRVDETLCPNWVILQDFELFTSMCFKV